MKTRSRFAFTMIEVLVVFAILAFLMGLLLPIVQRIRAAAARMESQNNLKQLGIGCHSYHDSYKRFPPGMDDKGFSAAAHLLPFVEQDNLYKQINFNVPARAQVNDLARNTRISIFTSPMDPLSEKAGKTAPISYLYSAGTKYSLDKNNGVFFKESKVGIQMITDGTSNTLMIGETLIGDGSNQATDVRRQHVELNLMALANLNDNSGVQEFKDNKNIAGDRCASWIEGKFLYGTFTGTRKINDERSDVNAGGLGGLSALRGLQKGVNIAMCDGSVRFVNDNIDYATWQALCTRDGGEPVGLP